MPAEGSGLCSKSGTREQRAPSPCQAATGAFTHSPTGINCKIMSKDLVQYMQMCVIIPEFTTQKSLSGDLFCHEVSTERTSSEDVDKQKPTSHFKI